MTPLSVEPQLEWSLIFLDTREYLGRRVTASASYLGSVFSSAWNKTAQKANEATTTGSSLISSALTKVSGGNLNQKYNFEAFKKA